MLFVKLAIALGAAPLLGGISAHPVTLPSEDGSNTTTSDIRPRLPWDDYAPPECSTLLYHCLTFVSYEDAAGREMRSSGIESGGSAC